MFSNHHLNSNSNLKRSNDGGFGVGVNSGKRVMSRHQNRTDCSNWRRNQDDENEKSSSSSSSRLCRSEQRNLSKRLLEMRRSDDSKGVWDWFCRQSEPEKTFDIFIHNIVLSAVSMENACRLFMKMSSDESYQQHLRPDLITYSTMLTVMVKNEMWSDVVSIFYEIGKCGMKPDAICFSIVLKALGKCGDWNGVLNLFQSMIVSSETDASVATPTLITYNTVIGALAGNARWEEALQVFEKLKLHFAPNNVTYGSIISAMNKGCQPRRAISLFAEMRRTGVLPGIITYNTLLSALGQRVRGEQKQHQDNNFRTEVEAIWCEIRNDYQRLRPTTITYNSMLHAIATNPTEEEDASSTITSIAVFEEMMRHNVRPTTITFCSLIHGLHASQWKIGECVIQDIMFRHKISPNIITYCCFLQLLGDAQQWEKCNAVFKNSIQPLFSNADFDEISGSYNAILLALSKSPHWAQHREMTELLITYKTIGLVPTQSMYHSLIASANAGKDWKRTLEILNEMKQCSSAAKPTLDTYIAVLNGLVTHRDQWHRSVSLVQEIMGGGGDGISPNEYIYQILMQHLLLAGQPTIAVEVVKSVIDRGELFQNVGFHKTLDLTCTNYTLDLDLSGVSSAIGQVMIAYAIKYRKGQTIRIRCLATGCDNLQSVAHAFGVTIQEVHNDNAGDLVDFSLIYK